MIITEVRVRKVEFEGKTRAFASITFDDSFVIHDLRVVEGDRGLFVAMPNRRLPNGERKDIAHPLNNEFRDVIQARVLEEYDR
ncbi:MAG: septation regulator SpoVG [Armatimonadetes bacterium]|nr:septation regulator SpoVG [Armatimonadota bacterium]